MVKYAFIARESAAAAKELKWALAAIALAIASFLLVVKVAFAQSSDLEGARYSYVTKQDAYGNWESVFYRITGNTVTAIFQTHLGSSNKTVQSTTTSTITNGSFLDRVPAATCLNAWNTDDCGRLGVIKDDAIYLSFVVNGKPLQQTGALLIAPTIPRQY